MKKLILIGGGGHCMSVIDAAESAGYNIIGILDLPENVGKQVLNTKIIGSDDSIADHIYSAYFVITLGFINNPHIRINLFNKVKSLGGCLATIVASTARVSGHAKLGEGTVVLHQAAVNAGAEIGHNCIINTFANIEHGCSVGDHTHISTGAIVNGDCEIGSGVFIGSQSVLSNNISVTDNVIISAGSFVYKNVLSSGTYFGNPLRKIK